MRTLAPEPSPLPAHIEETVRAISDLHLEHHRALGPARRFVSRLTRAIGRPRFIVVLTTVLLAWIGLNLALRAAGLPTPDPAPFQWLQTGASTLALYITVLILITQRTDDRLAEQREQLTLQLALLSDQKSAKIIDLLEELRRDHPDISNREDRNAVDMAKAADPQAITEALRMTHHELLAANQLDGEGD